MAYINVAEWTPDQVTDWLKGLDDSMYNYVYSFTNNEVGGKQLLNIRPYELEQLGMTFIGHQEIVLEAVEHLRNFHYNLDKENLQFLALHVASAARSLYKQLTYCDKSKLETQILNDISRTIATTKPIISWLDRSPFHGQLQFNEIRKNMLRLGLEMATSAQRDRFVENPVDQIRMIAEKLAQLADYIIQDITDPMLLQPCALNLVTLKKRESELGFNIVPSYHGIHRISDIKYNSPAHNSGKIEDGDEIVQINYQTVVGWQYKTVMLQLTESPPDVLITLKKRPKHTKIYGQIYMQPYRLPSKKRALPGRWGDNNLPSPRPNLQTVHQDFTLPLKIAEKHNSSDTDSSCSDILTPTDSKSVDKEIRLYLPKPRAVLQRRNTICGNELSNFKNIGNIPFWHERKARQNGEASSPSLRDKSVSFGFGLELAPRPTTCLGLTGNTTKFNDLLGLNNSLPQISPEKPTKIEEQPEKEQKSKPGVSKVVRFDANMKYDDYPADNKYTCNVENTILETFEPIPYADEDDFSQCVDEERSDGKKEDSGDFVQCINASVVNRRGRLDKSHSTPAYDNSDDDSDTPPAIEPRKEFLQNTPPSPPPRPKRQADIQPPAVPPTPKPQLFTQTEKPISRQPAPVLKVSPSNSILSSPPINNIPATIHFLQETTKEESELVTPTKTKSLTLKKKNILLAKRRHVTLKALGTSDIQGHLYRRTKDKRGVTFWAKLYFVLIETVLYGFKKKDSRKASCMVFLPGFTVSLAKEVHSKPFAFKVYHPMKTFYFAAESIEALNQWMEFIRQATLQEKVVPDSVIAQNIKKFFSETDNSDDDDDIGTKQLCTPSPIAIHLARSPLYSNSNQAGPDTPTSSSPSKHERYLGSLKKFTPFKSAEKKPSASDIPVPTAQFRSYRKVPGGTHGLQIGTNTGALYQQDMGTHGITSASFQSYLELTRKQSIASTHSIDSKISNSDHESFLYQSGSKILGDSNQKHSNTAHHSESAPNIIADSTKKLRKNSPYNYIHASNPNLVEFDFQTSKSMDFSLPKINPSNSWDAHNNLQGFVTLKDLMLRKQEEEAQDNYNNRVLLGVEKKSERLQMLINRRLRADDCPQSSSGGGKLSKIQSRSLPKTPDYEMSFNPDDEDIKRTRTKEGLKLRDFGYEFIYGDEPSNGSGSTKARTNEKTGYGQLLGSKKKTSQASVVSEIGEKTNRGGSFKKTKGKFEAFKTSSEKLFQFKHSDHHKSKGGSTSSYAPMTLPLNKKSCNIIYGGSHADHASTHVNIKKSHTYNSEFKEKKIETSRKNSAPVPILTKFVLATKTPMERKLLGSPSLHRAIFGRQHSSGTTSAVDLDHEVFSPIVFGKSGYGTTEAIHSIADDVPSTVAFQPVVSLASSSITTSFHTTPDYPNMEYPPVFEPETYSLSDPNASLNLLRRRNDLDD